LPKNPRLRERNPWHEVYKNDREYQSRIICSKLRYELCNGRKLNLQEQCYVEAAAVLIIELRYFRDKYLAEKRSRPSKQFYSTLNSLRVTLAQLPRKGKRGKPKGGETSDLDLTSIIKGD
jgi:hypothetical protein